MIQVYRNTISDSIKIEKGDTGMIVSGSDPANPNGDSSRPFEDLAGDTTFIDRACDCAVARAQAMKDKADQMIADIEAKRTELKDNY